MWSPPAPFASTVPFSACSRSWFCSLHLLQVVLPQQLCAAAPKSTPASAAHASALPACFAIHIQLLQTSLTGGSASCPTSLRIEASETALPALGAKVGESLWTKWKCSRKMFGGKCANT
eukprot:TRINITY_DN40680_c0_g1_i1.p1 TRINITY_DN40680_c0_g1~~TRINITY_DN40680_c0_g1_i1.p1  ORF type:complete len:119 (-),score=16.73 TRINITY_DN40680_c0_g1_i1:31-387(-)